MWAGTLEGRRPKARWVLLWAAQSLGRTGSHRGGKGIPGIALLYKEIQASEESETFVVLAFLGRKWLGMELWRNRIKGNGVGGCACANTIALARTGRESEVPWSQWGAAPSICRN